MTNLTDAQLTALAIEHYPNPDDPDGCWSCCEAWVCPTAEALAELRELRGKLELTTGRPVAYFSSTSRPGFITPEKTPNNGPTLSLTGESRSQPTTTTSGEAISRGNSGRVSPEKLCDCGHLGGAGGSHWTYGGLGPKPCHAPKCACLRYRRLKSQERIDAAAKDGDA